MASPALQATDTLSSGKRMCIDATPGWLGMSSTARGAQAQRLRKRHDQLPENLATT